MMRYYKVIILFCLLFSSWQASCQTTYAASKVVYDVSSANALDIKHLLDRASLLQNIYGSDPFEASIIFVIHEGAIPLFTKSNPNKTKLAQRASNLSLGEVIQFRVCAASARMQGYSKKDFDAFIALVPMADAEIIQLQKKGYAYLR